MKRFLLLGSTLALLSACSFGSATIEDGTSSSSSSLPETANVSYMGTVDALGPSVYMEGTHQLTQDDGKTVLLESTLLHLEDYEGMEVQVFGAVRPTVEAGGIIMRVNAITILSSTSSSSEASSEMTSEAVTSASSAAITSSKAAVMTTSSSKSSAAAAMTSASTAGGLSADLNARASAMAKVDMSADKWTQQYCTSHIGFCVPVHKNWWYTSFGTSGSALWHVEVNNAEINGLGDGVIVVNLMTGASGDSVSENGDYVVATHNWKDNTHFEVSAPKVLKAAVTHMAQSITTYQVSQ